MPRYVLALLILIILTCGRQTLAADAPLLTAEQAAPIYAAELGSLYHPEDRPRLYAAHQLIEQYFATSIPTTRKDIVAQLTASQLNINLIGRLTRLRLGWQDLAPGVYYVNVQVGAHPVKYFLGVPKAYRRIIAWPLVLKLPAINAFQDNPPPKADEVVKIYSGWIQAEIAAHPDALVLMPLLNLAELYGPSHLGMDTVYQSILEAADRANIDPARVYMVGHSMGAEAVWNIALHYPTYFAAINPLAGSAGADWQRLRLPNLRNLLPVVWADSADTVIPEKQSSDIVETLQKLKIDVDFEPTTGVGHVPPPDVVERDYQKIRARSRDLYPKLITMQSDCPETIFNRIDWIQVYQELNPGQDVQIRLHFGTGPMRLYQNAFSLVGTFENNVVHLTANNVETLRLYFNEQMVDFSKPLVVMVNERERFRGMLTPSIDEMLKDQLFLGRGWRRYSAVVDVDTTTTSTTPTPAPANSPSSTATTRHTGRITIYNEDGSVQRVIEPP